MTANVTPRQYEITSDEDFTTLFVGPCKDDDTLFQISDDDENELTFDVHVAQALVDLLEEWIDSQAQVELW